MGVALDKKDVRLVKTINQYKDVSYELDKTKAELRVCREDNARELQKATDLLNKFRRELHRTCKICCLTQEAHFSV